MMVLKGEEIFSYWLKLEDARSYSLYKISSFIFEYYKINMLQPYRCFSYRYINNITEVFSQYADKKFLDSSCSPQRLHDIIETNT
jgi:hypothetical protein